MKLGLSGTLLLGAFLIGPGIPVATAQHGGHSGGGGGMSMPSVPAVRTGKVKGRLVQASPESITVETEKKGQTERSTYMLNERTKKKGDLEAGAEVVVKYREEPGAPVATSVEAKKPKNKG